MYVDEIVLIGNYLVLFQHFTHVVKFKFALKELRSLLFFLGIEDGQTSDVLHMSQSKYVNELLYMSGLIKSKSSDTSVNIGRKFLKLVGDKLQDLVFYKSIYSQSTQILYLNTFRYGIYSE